MSADCVFCKIIEGKIPAPRVYEDENVICIRDIQPQAKVHLLVIPKVHARTLMDVDGRGVASLFEAAQKIAHTQGLLPGGFRSVINTGVDGGQTVFHLHLHLLGGERLRGGFA
jgi:histidine triad (HIT) family protein